MNPLLLPREVGATDAWLSVVVSAEDPRPSGLELRGGPAPIAVPDAWIPVTQVGPISAWYQRVRVTGLEPGKAYQLALVASGSAIAECRLATLPERLPSLPAREFTMLFASCFSVLRDPTGAFGRAFLRLPQPFQPDVAILTGDQVYLDTPIGHFLLRTHSANQLAAEFNANYAATWAQRTPDGGFGAFASRVATFLGGDDHELWNNAPNVAPHLPDTWFESGRRTWTELAIQLFDSFQTPRRLHAIEIPPLSVRVVDTRFSRSADRTRFMDPTVMDEIAEWLSALQGPGVLVLGQPILSASTGWRGYFTDWTLTDYVQYEELVRALLGVAHDVVVIAGDVHFGRVAEVRLPNGRRIVEIVSSPMCLVDERAGRSWRPPPATFPARPIPGAVAAPVTVGSFRTAENQFATLALRSEGGEVAVRHTGWQIGRDGSAPTALAGFSGRLH